MRVKGLLRRLQVAFARDVLLVVVDEADVIRGRQLGDGVQAQLWQTFTAKYGVYTFRMTEDGMVPLG